MQLETLKSIVGKELPCDDLNRHLKAYVQEFRAPVVGALRITCADESENECVQSFQSVIAQPLLPSLKLARQAPFRIANLGGRYEWGSVQIAENHFATPKTKSSFKVLLVKINSHVCVHKTPDGPVFGKMDRYKTTSEYCGALHALMRGGTRPFIEDLKETFASEGLDRVALLNDPDKVEPRYRPLFAALANARLQARKAVMEIQDYEADTPTFYLIAPTVTLNRKSDDHEILCGFYTADDRQPGPPEAQYYGLGDDPRRYRLTLEWGSIEVTEDGIDAPRKARDHRELIREQLEQAKERRKDYQHAVNQAIKEVKQTQHWNPKSSKKMLKVLLRLLADINPVSASLFLFAESVADIRHVFQAHEIAKDMENDEEAKAMLAQIQAEVDHMPKEKAERIIHLLANEYGVDLK